MEESQETPSQQQEPHPILSWITDPAEDDVDSLDEITCFALDEIRIEKERFQR